MEFRCGGLLFTSKFDSGNLARVEKVSKDEDDDDPGKNVYRRCLFKKTHYWLGFGTNLSLN